MASDLHLLSLTMKKMATDFQFEVVVEKSRVNVVEALLMEAFKRVEAIESEITEFREESPVARFNRSEGGWVDCSPDLMGLLKLSLHYSKESGGYFDPFAKTPRSAVRSPLGSDIEMDEEGGRIRRLTQVHLGFGAIGKGYALDAVASLLERNGESDFRLNSGGSSWVFSGLDPLGEAWRVGWAWAKDADGDFVGKTLELPRGKPLAIGISGTLEQGNHFLHKGVSCSTHALSSFYVGRSAAEADACSTALFVGSIFEGEKILTQLESPLRAPAMAYVDLEQNIVYNKTFGTMFSI